MSMRESFRNLLESSLNPMVQDISFSHSVVIQCAFGSIVVDGI